MSEVLAAVWVPGVPRTKGSLDEFHQDSPASKRWRKLVAAEVARDGRLRHGEMTGAVPGFTYAGPVAVRCVFVRADGVGDIDKLARNVLDALTDSRVIADDVQVVKLHCDRIERTIPTRGDGAFVLMATVDTSYGAGEGQKLGNEIDAWVRR